MRNVSKKTSINPSYLNAKIRFNDNIYTKDKFGNTPLHMAATWGEIDLAKFIIKEYPESLNTKNKKGQTPLHLAMIWKEMGIAKYLLQAGANITITDSNKKTAFQHCQNATLPQDILILYKSIKNILLQYNIKFLQRLFNDQRDADQLLQIHCRAPHQKIVSLLSCELIATHLSRISNEFLCLGKEPDKIYATIIKNGLEEIAKKQTTKIHLVNQPEKGALQAPFFM